MAIKSIKEKTNLKLELDGGMVGDKQKLISKSYSKIKTDAPDQALYETAVALETLQNKSIINVKRVEEVRLTQE